MTSTVPQPDGFTMLSRPWTSEEQAALDALRTVEAPDPRDWVTPYIGPDGEERGGYVAVPDEPIDGWGPDEQWRDLVGRLVPDIAEMPRVEATRLPSGLTIERLGPSSWMVRIGLGEFLFRDVVTHRGMEADVSVSTGGIHLFRTTATLSLTGRRTLAKGAIERAVGVGTEADWHRATDLACEAVMEAVEGLGDGIDLRAGDVTDFAPSWVCEPLWTSGASMLVMPGEIGKSTLARAMAVSITTGRMIVPGLYPRIAGPVMYVASEDPGEATHRRSIEAICRGAGVDRRNLHHEIRLIASNGQPLHRLARRIAERSRDHAGIILDAMQGLLPGGETGVRDAAAMFWNAIDEIGKPVFVVAHPNLSQARGWKDADGRAAGAEVNRDRARLSRMGRHRDEPSVAGTYHRVFSMECTKWNDGDKSSLTLDFRRTWSPGSVAFSPATAQDLTGRQPETLPPQLAKAWEAYQDGARTGPELAVALDVTDANGRKLLQRLREAGVVL